MKTQARLSFKLLPFLFLSLLHPTLAEDLENNWFQKWEDTNHVTSQKLAAYVQTKCATNAPAWCATFSAGGKAPLLPEILRSRALTLTFLLKYRSTMDTLLSPVLDAYLTDFPPTLEDQITYGHASGAGSAHARTAVFNLVTGLDVNAIADSVLKGLAMAIRKRAEQEAIALAVDQLQRSLCAPNNRPYLKYTCSAFDQGILEPSGGKSAYVLLRLSLRKDLRRLPGVAAKSLILYYDGKAVAAKEPSLAALADPTEALIDNLQNPKTPLIKALDVYAHEIDERAGTNRKVRIFSFAAGLPSSVLRLGPEIHNADDTIQDSEAQVAWTMLVLLEGPKYSEANGKVTTANINGYFAYALKITAHYDSGIKKFSNLAKELRDSDPDEDTGYTFEAANAWLDLVQATLAFPGLLESGDSAKASDQINLARKITLMLRSVATGDYESEWMDFIGLCAEDPSLCAHFKPIYKSGGLMLSLAEAKTSDQVSDLLIAAADPINSWKLKYDESRGTSVSLGGMLGFGYAFNRDEYAPRLVSAVGFDVARPIGESGFNYGVFVQLLDVGVYLQPNSDSSGVGLKAPRILQAFSPGLGFRLGLFRLPLVLIAGSAFDLDRGDGKAGAHAYLSAVMDVPFFTLK